MVARTAARESLKKGGGFLPPIKQPLPLSRHESRKLLDSITTSFRKNLDADNHRPADNHLRAVLSNPLFSHTTENTRPTSFIPSQNHGHVFDAAVHRGLMTPRRAAGFLAKVRLQINDESIHDNIRVSMGRSGAALRVVEWLRSCGQERDLRFLGEPILVRNLVPFLYAEGLQETMWTWLARLATRIKGLEIDQDARKACVASLSCLLQAIVEETSVSHLDTKISLDTSYESLFRAREMLPAQNILADQSIAAPWSFLSWASTVNANDRPKPSVSLFESFVRMTDPRRRRLDIAHLNLYHPTAPDHSNALAYMRQTNHKLDDVPVLNHLSPRSQGRLLWLACDTAGRLKRIEHADDEISWVRHFLTRICNIMNPIVDGEGHTLSSQLPLERSLALAHPKPYTKGTTFQSIHL